jgi:hypothetical protein
VQDGYHRGMKKTEEKEINWTRTYITVGILGVVFVILFWLFTITFNTP